MADRDQRAVELEAAIGTAAIVFVNIAFRPLARMLWQPAAIADQEVGYSLKVNRPRF